jgi:hypothetical protein
MQMSSSEAEFAENRATAQKASQQRDWAEKRLAADTERLSRLLEEVERERDNVKVRLHANDPNAGHLRAACGIIEFLPGVARVLYQVLIRYSMLNVVLVTCLTTHLLDKASLKLIGSSTTNLSPGLKQESKSSLGKFHLHV